MAREVKQVTFTKAAIPMLTRVAAYARVSSAKNAMHHSLSAQVSYYSGLIQNHPGWQYIGVYADEAKTGTKDTREGFVKLVSDCKAGGGRYGHHQIHIPLCPEYGYFAGDGPRSESPRH